MPYNSETSAYERRAATVIDATPDGDTVAVAIDVKLDQGIDDYVADLNHHNVNGNHYPATSVGGDSRFLRQSPAGVVSWANGVVAADAALKDFSNVAAGAIASDKLASVAPAKIAQDASNRFFTDTERTKLTGIETGAQVTSKARIEAALTGEITSHTHSAASESAKGLVELATTAGAAAGTDTSRAVTAAGVDAYHKANNINIGRSAAASGTAVDFVGIPAWVKRITVMFDWVSTNGTSPYLIQLGSTTGVQTTGYRGSGSGAYGTQISTRIFTQGLGVHTGRAEDHCQGHISLIKFSDKTWTMAALMSSYGTDTLNYFSSAGVTLASTLDRIRITTENGTDQFNAGTINILWEF